MKDYKDETVNLLFLVQLGFTKIYPKMGYCKKATVIATINIWDCSPESARDRVREFLSEQFQLTDMTASLVSSISIETRLGCFKIEYETLQISMVFDPEATVI